MTGPKAWDFYDQFCKHRATLLKADGKDIVAVAMALNSGRESCWRNARLPDLYLFSRAAIQGELFEANQLCLKTSNAQSGVITVRGCGPSLTARLKSAIAASMSIFLSLALPRFL